MVSESRFLVFSNEELLGALSAIMLFREDRAPEGTTPTITFSTKNNSVDTMLTYTDKEGAEAAAFSFNAEEVGAALIYFCMQTGIPLPRKVEKSIELNGDNVSLVLQHDSTRTSLKNPVDIPTKVAEPKASDVAEEETDRSTPPSWTEEEAAQPATAS